MYLGRFNWLNRFPPIRPAGPAVGELCRGCGQTLTADGSAMDVGDKTCWQCVVRGKLPAPLPYYPYNTVCIAMCVFAPHFKDYETWRPVIGPAFAEVEALKLLVEWEAWQ